MRLKDKIAIVTGAASGIGRATALKFAEEGAIVIATARRKGNLEEIAEIAKSKNQVIVPFPADLMEIETVGKIVDFAVEKFGRLDVLVNCAGILDGFYLADEFSDEIWDKVMKVNVEAPAKLARRAFQEMLPKGKGVVINVSSVAGTNGCKGGTVYTTSKHALVGFTKSAGYAYATKGIRCLAILPGRVATDILPGYERNFNGLTQSAAGNGVFGPTLASGPMRAQPEELANVIAFAASDEASFANGCVWTVDGGWSAM